MPQKYLFAILLCAFGAGCSSTYKNAQTPDDVYYSPARETGGETNADTRIKKDEYVRQRGYADRNITMQIYDRRWRYFGDEYNAFYDPYRYGYSCGYYYNPYYYPSPVFITGATCINPLNTKPRTANLGGYNYSNMMVVDPKSGNNANGSEYTAL